MGNKTEDLTGRVFGDWTVTGHLTWKINSCSGQHIPHWGCTCKCGNQSVVRAANLKNGGAKRCYRCSRNVAGIKSGLSRRKNPLEIAIRHAYKIHARNKDGKKGFLDFETWDSLRVLACFYCGKPPREIYPALKSDGTLAWTCTLERALQIHAPVQGIDRWINSKPYGNDNVVPCCRECNNLKGDRMDGPEFVKWIAEAAEHLSRK